VKETIGISPQIINFTKDGANVDKMDLRIPS